MTHGKNICNQLKEVRKRIAEENDIPLETEECSYKGECRGTCPRCEAEVRYLENALADRLRLGKVATVAGLLALPHHVVFLLLRHSFPRAKIRQNANMTKIYFVSL